MNWLQLQISRTTSTSSSPHLSHRDEVIHTATITQLAFKIPSLHLTASRSSFLLLTLSARQKQTHIQVQVQSRNKLSRCPSLPVRPSSLVQASKQRPFWRPNSSLRQQRVFQNQNEVATEMATEHPTQATMV